MSYPVFIEVERGQKIDFGVRVVGDELVGQNAYITADSDFPVGGFSVEIVDGVIEVVLEDSSSLPVGIFDTFVWVSGNDGDEPVLRVKFDVRDTV